MKLEMGESLMASWLKHIHGCQIVQLNWKPSNKWENEVPIKDIENLLKNLKKSYKEIGTDFLSKKVKSSQLIQQGEIDCLGISLKPGENNKFYAVDVAFHEGGLNYGSKEATRTRILKKYIRTALSLYYYLGTKEAVIVFASPKVLDGHEEIFKQVAIDVQQKFKDLEFNFEFKLLCNKDFSDNIFIPVIDIINDIADTSELFLRSLKLYNLHGQIHNQSKKIQRIKTINNKPDDLSEIKIGSTVVSVFTEFSNNNNLPESEIANLLDTSYSKEKLGININLPVLIKKTSDEDICFVNGRRRYYAKSFTFHNNEYYLCNHWTESNRELFKNWLQKFQNQQ